MTTPDILALVLTFIVAAIIQTNTGFAFGLIVMASVAIFKLVSIEIAALLISFLTFINSVTAFKGQQQYLLRTALFSIIIPCIPATIFGVWLLDFLSKQHQAVLELLLGTLLIISSLLMMFNPQPRAQVAPKLMFHITGLIAGVMGGIFGIFGPPIVFMLYRQPYSILMIRVTLFAVFSITALIRISSVLVVSLPPIEVFLLVLFSIPIVIITTLISKKYRIPLSDRTTRQIAFILLTLAGITLTFSGIEHFFLIYTQSTFVY